MVNSLESGLGMLIHFIFIALYLLVWGVNIVQVGLSPILWLQDDMLRPKLLPNSVRHMPGCPSSAPASDFAAFGASSAALTARSTLPRL